MIHSGKTNEEIMGQAQKKFSIRIPLNPVAETELSSDLSEYCYLMNNDIKQGPYLKTEVENLITKNPHFTAHLVIVDMEESSGSLPQISADVVSISGDVFLLSEGQKVGPFSMEEITEKLQQKELLYTDYFSLDGGMQWLKISEHEQFNRRKMTREENLPSMPENKFFENNTSAAVPPEDQK